MLLGYSDAELANLGGYDLVHYDDLAYVASAHQERKWQYYASVVFVFGKQLGVWVTSQFLEIDSDSTNWQCM
jgi:hypothetical protein